jgi:GNAT superfamily N-acetyltransferase
MHTTRPAYYHIVQSEPADMDLIFSLFDAAIAYQEKKGYDLWPQFGREMIATEIVEGRHWKIMDGEAIACVFSVLYNDPVIWMERDLEPAVYLHRIAVNPICKGKGMMTHIRQWAIQHARENNKHYVRMDTWGHNEVLRNYYISCGFPYIGQQQLQNTSGLPAHYGGNHLSLFQIEVK